MLCYEENKNLNSQTYMSLKGKKQTKLKLRLFDN